LSFFLLLYIFGLHGGFIYNFTGFFLYIGSPFPFEFDLEIEMTFRSRRKKLRVKVQRLKAQAISSSMAGVGGDQRRTLRYFVTPGVKGISSSIARPTVEANSFELKPALISMMQQSHFGGMPLEDLNLHFSVF